MTTFSTKELELESWHPQHRKRWTREDCDFLERVGFLSNRYELLDGEIIEKVGQNRPHIMTTTRALLWLAGTYGNDRVQGQADIEVAAPDQPANKPQPDAAVLSKPDFNYPETVSGNDLLLAVEVSDTTLRDDLVKKAALYARAGVPEFWVFDVLGRKLFVHSEPVEGVYTNITALTENDKAAPLSAPSATVLIADLLPPILSDN